MGRFSATVCLVSGESAFNSARYESGSNRFHAHSDLAERLLVLNVERVGFIAPASAYALAQHALWQHNGNEPFPVPIAKVIGQWYRARILDRLELYHADVMYGTFSIRMRSSIGHRRPSSPSRTGILRTTFQQLATSWSSQSPRTAQVYCSKQMENGGHRSRGSGGLRFGTICVEATQTRPDGSAALH